MKTVAEIVSWLNSPNIQKCTLVDISDVSLSAQSSFYFSSRAYYDSGIAYTPIVEGGLVFSESLSSEGSVSMGYGSIELSNTGGSYDVLLTYVWKRRPIKIYLGDQTWAKEDFVLIFDGLVEDLTAGNENTISISLFDKLQKLNDELISRTLKDTEYSQNTLDTVLPSTFGEVFNVQPLLVDNGSLDWTGAVYMAHDGAISDFIEVRENGVPISVTKNTANGTFAMLTKPIGTITCSVQGATPYTNTVAGIVSYIVQNYGSEYNRFGSTEIDFSGFSNTAKVGVHCKDRSNILQVCADLAKSVNSNLICPSISISDNTVVNSKLKLVEIKTPSGSPKYTLTDSDMLEGTLAVSETFSVKPSIKLAYCKNYTLQQTVAQALNPASDLDKEYLYVTQTNSTVQELYKDSGEVAEEQTLLLVTSDAETEAAKRLTLWQTQRFLITAKYLPQFIFVQLGDIVNIQSTRFNLSQGKLGMVYSINRDWLTGLVEIGVLV